MNGTGIVRGLSCTAALLLASATILNAGVNDGYVGCNSSDDAAPFDLSTYSAGTAIPLPGNFNYPYDATLTPDGSEVWLADASTDEVHIIDRMTDAIVTSILVSEYTVGVAFSPDGSLAMATGRDGESISVIDTATYSVTSTLPVAADMGNIATDPSNGTFYVAEWYKPRVFHIAADGSSVLNSATVGDSLWQLVVDPDGSVVYVTDRGAGATGADPDLLRVIDPVTLAEIRSIEVCTDPWGVDITADGGKIVVVCRDDETVFIIETVNWTSTQVELPAGAESRDVDILDSRNLAFIAGGEDAKIGTDPVYVLDLVTDSLVDTIDVDGGSVQVIAVQPELALPCNDGDGDGYGDPGSADCANGPQRDCDDGNFDVNPGAAENCTNTIDDDCDTFADCDDTDCRFDLDGDTSIAEPCGPDCDDGDGDITGIAPEALCLDGKDNDCDTFSDCDDTDCQADADGDTHLAEPCGPDCDDNDGDITGVAPETLCSDTKDNDCDTFSDCDDTDCQFDADGDTHLAEPCGPDCDDNDGDITGIQPETLCSDTKDNDCDTFTDIDDPDCQSTCNDGDGDGYGSPGDASCPNGPEEDCDDGNFDVNPGAAEICDNTIDDDCDTFTDCDDTDCNTDVDGDTWVPTPCGQDCDDGDRDVWQPPVEAAGLLWANRTDLAWEDLSLQAGPGTAYHVLRGDLDALPVGGGPETCLGTAPGNNFTDPTAPGGEHYYYLVRGTNQCADGTYGYDWEAAERDSAACP